MSYNSDSTDPIVAAAESLQYGATDDAATALRGAIQSELARASGSSRIAAEHHKSMQSLAKFIELNDAYRDPIIQRAAHTALAGEQYADLVNAGILDPEKFKEQMGRDVNEQDVFNIHLQCRANGARGLRSNEDLLKSMGNTLESKFGIRQRITDIDQNRTRRAREMEDQRRALRGLPPVDRGEDAPRPRIERDQPATEEALRNLALAGFGLQNEQEAERADAERKARHSEAIARMREGRTAPNTSRVQISRTTDDSRFARQAG